MPHQLPDDNLAIIFLTPENRKTYFMTQREMDPLSEQRGLGQRPS